MTTTAIQLRFNDIDLAGHAHNAVYLSWFEQARMDLLHAFVGDDHDWKTLGLILARNEVDYLKPVRLRDVVEVDCSCSKIGGKSFDLSYALFVRTGDHREPYAKGRSVMVCFNYEQGASIPLPDAWRSSLARMMKEEQ
jgi:acyl-CoA thioester hydrolase